MSKAAKRERQRLNREARKDYEQSLARRRRTMKTGRTFALLAIPVIAIGVILSLGSSDDESAAVAAGCRDVEAAKPKDVSFPSAPPLTINPFDTYVARIDTSCGSFVVTLAANQAPQTANSFVYLAQQGFYDGLGFDRIVKDFVAQGGDPKGDTTGGPGYTLPDEPPTEGYLVGSVAMANAGPGTTGSQFYIVTSEKGAQTLNSQKTADGKFSYSILGQVTEGFETVKKIDKLGTNTEKGKPKAPVRILKVTIETIDPNATTTTVPATTPPG